MTETELLLLENGQTEKIIISNTAEWKGRGRLIHVIVAAVFSLVVDNNLVTGSYTGITFPVGTVLGGDFRNLKLTSGTIIVYS